MSAACGHKSLILTAARAYGLAIPKTRVTNERETLSTAMAEGPAIVKPVAGGAYTLDATAADAQTDWHDGRAPVPAFVQEKLRYPELRVFFVGSAPHVFEIVSDDLDYRAGRNHSIVYRGASALDGLLAKKLAALAADLGLDFCAFDLKTADDGDLRFMEVNSGPMFAAFDEVARGALCAAMIDWLMARK
ncbi:hypothetical protein [Breoghania sp. L-A4]|uniref:hypothetical protein n=1 Tax=Breoghania sp. L-A4 TaxID=2304600 RepID=UPI000E35D5AC|nr:hypothetical protein [Breoghania sp. L-A4]AXS42294.1 hypothetical protein D1F64_22770 [Breoghania sp. L-A4]